MNTTTHDLATATRRAIALERRPVFRPAEPPLMTYEVTPCNPRVARQPSRSTAGYVTIEVWVTPEELKEIQEIQAEIGAGSVTDIVQAAIRCIAAARHQKGRLHVVYEAYEFFARCGLGLMGRR